MVAPKLHGICTSDATLVSRCLLGLHAWIALHVVLCCSCLLFVCQEHERINKFSMPNKPDSNSSRLVLMKCIVETRKKRCTTCFPVKKHEFIADRKSKIQRKKQYQLSTPSIFTRKTTKTPTLPHVQHTSAFSLSFTFSPLHSPHTIAHPSCENLKHYPQRQQKIYANSSSAFGLPIPIESPAVAAPAAFATLHSLHATCN